MVVLLHDVGIQMVKVRKTLAPKVPPDVMTLMEMWEVALQDEATSCNECSVCGRGGEKNDTWKCCICLLSSHKRCLLELVTSLRSQVPPKPLIQARSGDVPDLFTSSSTRCEMCQHFFALQSTVKWTDTSAAAKKERNQLVWNAFES